MVTIEEIKSDEEVNAILEVSGEQLEALGFTEHSKRHASIVSKWTGDILEAVGVGEDRIRLGVIAGYLHDMGNSINRIDHAQSGAILAYNILTKHKMPPKEVAEIIMAIGNHDETVGLPLSDLCAALILADKADVHRSRVKNDVSNKEDINIHDRVNLAAERSFLTYDSERKVIMLNIVINTEISQIMEYFEIYFKRMQLCRRSAEYFGWSFSLSINGLKII